MSNSSPTCLAASCADYAGQTMPIGDGQRRVAEFGRPHDQFIRMRGPFEKREIRFAMQLRIRRRSRARRHGDNRWTLARRRQIGHEQGSGVGGRGSGVGGRGGGRGSGVGGRGWGSGVGGRGSGSGSGVGVGGRGWGSGVGVGGRGWGRGWGSAVKFLVPRLCLGTLRRAGSAWAVQSVTFSGQIGVRVLVDFCSAHVLAQNRLWHGLTFHPDRDGKTLAGG